MVCDGLVSRIFQHEVDHLDGVTMDSKTLEIKYISELMTEKDLDNFYEDQKHRILDM